MWGEIILSRIQNTALSKIPPYVKRNVKFEDICSALKTLYGGAMKVSENIMNAHMAAGEIPELFQLPVAALKVLRGHYEVLKHAERDSLN